MAERSDQRRAQSHDVRVRREFFEMIKKGDKTLEARIAYSVFTKIKVGDRVVFSPGDDTLRVEVIIDETTRFSTVEGLLKTVEMSKLLPGKSEAEIARVAQQIFAQKAEDVRRLGLIVFGFHKVEDK